MRRRPRRRRPCLSPRARRGGAREGRQVGQGGKPQPQQQQKVAAAAVVAAKAPVAAVAATVAVAKVARDALVRQAAKQEMT